MAKSKVFRIRFNPCPAHGKSCLYIAHYSIADHVFDIARFKKVTGLDPRKHLRVRLVVVK